MEEHVIDAADQSYLIDPAGGLHLSSVEISRLVDLHLSKYREMTRLTENGKIGRKKTGRKYKGRLSSEYNHLLMLPAGAEDDFRQRLGERSDAKEVTLDPGPQTATLLLRMVAPPVPDDPAE